MITIQLMGIVIGLGAIHLTYLYYRRSSFTKKELFFWSIIWTSFIFVAIFPNSVRPIVGYLGLQRPMDLIMIIAFIILFGVTFHNYVINHRQNERIEKLIRELAFIEFNKNLDADEEH